MKILIFAILIIIILSSCGESTTSPEPTIAAPTNVSAILISGSVVQVNWLDTTGEEEGFIVERKKVGEEYSSLCSTLADQTTYLDTLLAPNTVYYYRVAAFSGIDRSDWCYSNLVQTPIDVNAPSNLRIVYLSSNRIDLSWSDNTESETGFLLQRKIAQDDFQDLALLAVDEINYSDLGLDPVVEYTYRISAQFEGGQTDWSNEAEALTPPDLQEIEFGTEQTLDVMTWNIENFPKNDLVTVAYVAEIILSLDVDLVALQEIESNSYFNTLLDFMPNWEGYKANSASYNIDLAYLYKTDVVQVENIYEIYESDWYAFPRSPLVMEFSSFGEDLILINNHLKAGGDSEDEARREEASGKLENYITANFDDENLILVGDLNDEIQESEAENVFWNFISQPDLYLFADMEIAQGSYINWSYPNWPSHLDHILITDELFDEFESASSQITTLKIDNYLNNGWSEYESNISDHRPVALKILLND